MNKIIFSLFVVSTLVVFIVLTASPARADVFSVTNTNPSGGGSLVQAISDANGATGPHTINFNIPGPGPHIIEANPPAIIEPVTIDGTTQPLGQVIVQGATGFADGFELIAGADGSTIKGLTITGFPGRGIEIFGSDNNTIYGNQITDNDGSGILIRRSLTGDSADNNVVEHNLIGTDGFSEFKNGSTAVSLLNVNDNSIIDNVIVSVGNGISINASSTTFATTANDNIIQGNTIGVKADGVSPAGSDVGNAGIQISAGSAGAWEHSASDNIIGGTNSGEANIIANSGGFGRGIFLWCNGCTGEVNGNTIRANSIYANDQRGISLFGGANNDPNGLLSRPIITGAAAGSITGTSCAGCIIDIFSDAAGEGRIYHGSVTAGGTDWDFSGPVAGPFITATATNPVTGDTSSFSLPFAFTPPCGDVANDAVITTAKGQSPKNNPKLSHVFMAQIPDAAALKPTASRIRVCDGTTVEVEIVDLSLSGAPTQTGCDTFVSLVCTIDMNGGKKKYKAVSEDGKDTDALTLLPVP